jgi:hypothetical protein
MFLQFKYVRKDVYEASKRGEKIVHRRLSWRTREKANPVNIVTNRRREPVPVHVDASPCATQIDNLPTIDVAERQQEIDQRVDANVAERQQEIDQRVDANDDMQPGPIPTEVGGPDDGLSMDGIEEDDIYHEFFEHVSIELLYCDK